MTRHWWAEGAPLVDGDTVRGLTRPMNLARYIKPECIRMRLQTTPPAPEDLSPDISPKTLTRRLKERILAELVGLMEKSDRVGNPSKLLIDMINRERKATTGIGHGIAIPHVRTMHTRQLTMAAALCPEGIDFGAIDEQPVYFFLAMVAPKYADTLYLHLYKKLAKFFRYDWALPLLLNAKNEHDVIHILSSNLQ